MNAHRVRTASVILGAVLLVLGTIWASFAIVALPAHAAYKAACPVGGLDYCVTTFAADGISAVGGNPTFTNPGLITNDNPFDYGGWLIQTAGAQSTLTATYAGLNSYVTGATVTRGRVMYCWGMLSNVYSINTGAGVTAKLNNITTTVTLTEDFTFTSLGAPPCRVSSWVTYAGGPTTFNMTVTATDSPNQAGNTWISYLGLQVEYQIPATVVPGPTVTATVTPPTVTQTATETWYAYRSEVPVPSGTVAASLIPAVMADLRDVNIDDTDMAVLSRPPFVDEFFPAIITGVVIIVLVLSVTMWSAWGRRG